MTKKPYSADWEEDCLHYYGKVLTGKLGHWCADWDHLPIDETCREFSCCNCKPFLLREIKNRAVVKRIVNSVTKHSLYAKRKKGNPGIDSGS